MCHLCEKENVYIVAIFLNSPAMKIVFLGLDENLCYGGIHNITLIVNAASGVSLHKEMVHSFYFVKVK